MNLDCPKTTVRTFDLMSKKSRDQVISRECDIVFNKALAENADGVQMGFQTHNLTITYN